MICNNYVQCQVGAGNIKETLDKVRGGLTTVLYT